MTKFKKTLKKEADKYPTPEEQLAFVSGVEWGMANALKVIKNGRI